MQPAMLVSVIRSGFQVLLFMTGPGVPEGDIITEPAGQFDILPTLMAICSLDDTSTFAGVELFSEAARQPRPIPASQTDVQR